MAEQKDDEYISDSKQTLIPRGGDSNDPVQVVSPSSRCGNGAKQEMNVDSATTSHDVKTIKKRDTMEFKAYEGILLFLTQAGYLPVAASMLSTTFFEPSDSFCESYKNLTLQPSTTHLKKHALSEHQFYSLLFEWNEICRSSTLLIRISTAVMSGAVLGAFCSGYLADTFGRKPVIVSSLLLLVVMNFTLSLIGSLSPLASSLIFFGMGYASGGYMVTNVVLVIEAVKTERERLFVASMNGWPIGMAFTAFISYLSQEYRMYYMTTAATALVIATLLQLVSLESINWLVNQNRANKAENVREQINQRNSKYFLNIWRKDGKANYDVTIDDNQTQTKERELNDFSSAQPQSLTYIDLFRHSSIRRPLMALLYCFLSSSVVSFGFYFNADYLPGNRYLNFGLMGVLKFVLGLIPFFFSFLISKKIIILASVGSACISCWALVMATTALHIEKSTIVTVLGLAVTASMDPTWKVSHLYSVELFPTAIRNMARGACNVTARLGSMSGPLIIVLRSYGSTLPYWLFAILLTLQWMVLVIFMPKKSEDRLPERMPSKSLQ